jgi:hypothetical protein
MGLPQVWLDGSHLAFKSVCTAVRAGQATLISNSYLQQIISISSGYRQTEF